MIRNVSKEQVLDRIRFENPWWVHGQIDPDFDRMPRRLYFDLFKQLVEVDIRRAVVLMGPRRVGKTVLLHHLVKELIERQVDPRRIIFITIENPIYNNIGLEQLFTLAKEAAGAPHEEGWYLIFDEIQYLRDWEIHLKSLFDSYRRDKFIVSGSAAAALKFASKESGAGRFTDFLLPPLTFHEYIAMRDYDRIIQSVDVAWGGHTTEFYRSTHLDELNRLFVHYINFGGYPEVIFTPAIQDNPGRYIRQDIVDKVLLRDLPSLYGIRDTRELNSLFTTIAYNSGGEFSLQRLSQQSQVPKNTVKRYIEYLEAAYLIRLVRRIDQSGRKFKRDNFFKLYLTNPSLRSALFSPITSEDDMMGSMVETAVFAQWMHRDWFTPYYARWQKGEVDMVGLHESTLRPQWSLEIKWSDRYIEKPNELKSLIQFCQRNDVRRAIVTTIRREGRMNIQGIELQFIPAATYAYTVGRRTLDRRGMMD